MHDWGWLQCHISSFTASYSAVQWSLNDAGKWGNATDDLNIFGHICEAPKISLLDEFELGNFIW